VELRDDIVPSNFAVCESAVQYIPEVGNLYRGNSVQCLHSILYIYDSPDYVLLGMQVDPGDVVMVSIFLGLSGQ